MSKLSAMATVLALCSFASAQKTLPRRFVIDRSELSEISGLAASEQNPGIYWSHEDSGNAARLIAIDARGRPAFRYQLRGARNFDWEDMTLAPDAHGRVYLVIGDLGRNLSKLGNAPVRLWVSAEPVLGRDIVLPERKAAAKGPLNANKPKTKKKSRLPRFYAKQSHAWVVRYVGLEFEDYPDVEALYYDTHQRRFGLVSKNAKGKCEIWSLQPPEEWGRDTQVDAHRVARLRLRGSKPERLVTAAAYDAASRRLILCSLARMIVLTAPSLLPIPPQAHGDKSHGGKQSKVPKIMARFSMRLPKFPQIEALALLPAGGVLIASEGRPARFATLVLPQPKAAFKPRSAPASRPTKPAARR